MIHDWMIAIVCGLLGFFIGIQPMISRPAELWTNAYMERRKIK